MLIVAGVCARGSPSCELGDRACARPRHLAAFVLVIAGMTFYILLSETIGFVLCSVLVLFVLQWACGVRPRTAALVALAATLVIHTCFYKLLKVPLPWGVLQRWAW